MDEKAPVVEVKESSEKPESPKTEKTDVPDGELMKEEVWTKDTRASVEEAPEQRKKLGTGVEESGENMTSEPVEKEEKIPKEEEREPQPPTFVKKLPAKMDLKDGEDLLLQCITEGVPKPDGMSFIRSFSFLTLKLFSFEIEDTFRAKQFNIFDK